MGTYIIKTPDIGEGIAEVELVAWHVQVGESVTQDQVLADVMTEKATVEVPSPVTGKVVALGGTVGQTVAVGSELVRLEVAGVGNAKPGTTSATAPNVATADSLGAALKPNPAANLPSPPVSHTALPVAGERPIASPAVRRRAWELGIALEQVDSSGPAGRIVHADLDRYVKQHPAASKTAATSAVPILPTPRPALGAEQDIEQVIPVIGLRRKIAMKMQESKRHIPHFSYVEEVDVTELEALRERLNTRWAAERGRLTLLPFLVRALVLGARDVPQVSARFDDDKGLITRHSALHLGMATQTDNGLMVPVLRHAQSRDLWANAAEMARLAEAARSGRATREELSGSTLTLSSLGALGGIVSTPVINYPEVAIVGVNRIVERPMLLRGAVAARMMMNLSSSFDHRVVDGLDAARFIQAVRGYLEAPGTLFVD